MPHSKMLILVAALAVSLGQGAHAGLIERSIAVSHDDLDLSKPQDARVMLARVEHAARQACGTMPERDRAYASARHFVTKDFSGCTERATRQAVARLHAPVVSRLYAERHPSGDVRRAAN